MIERMHETLNGNSGAVFSDCERYRYRLWREWDSNKPTICFCMLNPSTANELENDPTIERCQRRAIAWGYGRLDVVNLFAWRSTDPRGLLDTDDPEGGHDNDEAILKSASLSKLVICGWGKHGNLRCRQNIVVSIMADAKLTMHALRINADGTPGHPLYIGYEVKPIPFGVL